MRSVRFEILVGVVLAIAGCAPRADQVRSELSFGRGIPGGGEVADDAWREFIVAEVAPRFPSGFTTLAAQGEWRDAHGALLSERSVVLIVVHPPGAQADAALDAIRTAYCARFHQESVLRVDQPVTASF